MIKFETIEDVIDFAIEEEEKSVDLYTELATQTTNFRLRTLFEQFAREELKHKVDISERREEIINSFANSIINRAELNEALIKFEPKQNMNMEEALAFAIKCEDQMCTLYLHLSNNSNNPGISNFFFGLSEMEANHKRSYEFVLDDILKLNEKV